MALCLQLVPVLSMFFLLTTAVGSALWVVKLEEQKGIVAQAVETVLVGHERDDPPPVYEDNPV